MSDDGGLVFKECFAEGKICVVSGDVFEFECCLDAFVLCSCCIKDDACIVRDVVH